MRLQILLILLFIGCTQLGAQSKFKMLNAAEYDADKYKDHKGSPYIWKENKDVVIFDKKGNEYQVIKGNYNGHENEFEVYQGSKFIQLPFTLYPKIKYTTKKGIERTMISNAHPDLNDKYCIEHHTSDNYSILEHFSPRESLVKIETPGKASEINKFIRNSEYYIVYGEQLIPFQLKKKKIIKLFGHKKKINAFLKENKMKVKKMEDVITLFDFLDSNGWLANPQNK